MASKEVDKRVNLDIRGGSVEMDRSVLERMAGPFEHLLRNHISARGSRARDVRRSRDKSETGELLVEVRQEGNEIVLDVLPTTAQALDYERIRSKGRELGLVGDEAISDTQAAELIFSPGFSTASQVTELAGRGVGMDVVREETIGLAGRIGIDSESGKGTRFTITLPLTLAVTQVVLVAVANRIYALPSVLVEQVQQLRPQALADAYRAGRTRAGMPRRSASRSWARCSGIDGKRAGRATDVAGAAAPFRGRASRRPCRHGHRQPGSRREESRTAAVADGGHRRCHGAGLRRDRC